MEVTAISVQQITRFNPAPKLDKSTKDWGQFEQIEKTVKWLDMEDDPISRRAGAIYGQIEDYVLQNWTNQQQKGATNFNSSTNPSMIPATMDLEERQSLLLEPNGNTTSTNCPEDEDPPKGVGAAGETGMAHRPALA